MLRTEWCTVVACVLEAVLGSGYWQVDTRALQKDTWVGTWIRLEAALSKVAESLRWIICREAVEPTLLPNVRFPVACPNWHTASVSRSIAVRLGPKIAYQIP